MNDYTIYSLSKLSSYSFQHDNLTLILSFTDEDRSSCAIEFLIGQKIHIDNLIIINYFNKSLPEQWKNNTSNVIMVSSVKNAPDFAQEMKTILSTQTISNILLDITCISNPDMFILIKILKKLNIESLNIVYSSPTDYFFDNEPFTSYHSYNGDLIMYEILGFSGEETTDLYGGNELYLFLGFESAMSLKVIENYTYDKLFLVNNLPAFYPKYKDISILNNYTIMDYQHTSLYVPANNPFEVYNSLMNNISKNKPVSIAPLSNKPTSLGICLYALDNPNVKIVYPMSKTLNPSKSFGTYETYCYSINF